MVKPEPCQIEVLSVIVAEIRKLHGAFGFAWKEVQYSTCKGVGSLAMWC